LSKIVITADQKALRTLSESFLIRATSVSSIASCIARVPRATQDGGAERIRTADLRLAKPPLSQLSYSPMEVGMPKWWA
jgi:hypothetical protein